MEVEPPPTEITTPNPLPQANVHHPSSTPTQVSHTASKDGHASFVLPSYAADIMEHLARVPTAQRIKLQIEVGDFKFLTITDPHMTLLELKTQLETEYSELYPAEMPIIIVRLQDSRRNDMPQRFKIGDLLKDKDKVFVIVKPMQSAEDETAEAAQHQPRQRGRKRKNQDQKDTHKLLQETPSKKPALSPQQTPMQASQPSPSQPSTPTQQLIPSQMHTPIPPAQLAYSPSAKSVLGTGTPSAVNAERIMCNPYCAIIDTREQVPCTHCGELRPYVVPDTEKTDKNQCSKWCVTGSTRKLKAAGLEFCSICLARHRAGKYDLRKAHQCTLCHRPWLHLDEYSYCRTCRKSAMGTERTPLQQQTYQPHLALPPTLPPPDKDQSSALTSHQLLSPPPSHPLLLSSSNGALPTAPPPPHLASPLSPPHLIPPHQRTPPQHITLHDLHKQADDKKGGQKQSIQLQGLQHFQQQLHAHSPSQAQLLVHSPPAHHASPTLHSTSHPSQKDDKEGGDVLTHAQDVAQEGEAAHASEHHAHTHEHTAHAHAHHGSEDADLGAHAHAHEHHAHEHAHAHEEHAHAHHEHGHHAHHAHTSAEQLADILIPTTGQEGEGQIGNSYYDTTMQMTAPEKVGS